MKTERIGVHAVASIIEEMGFVFREQPIEDYGIDAIIEERKPGYLSGKLIGVQIKGGESYFSGKEKNTYYIDEKHYDYWVNYSIPVIIVLYNPSSKLCIYDTIEKDKLVKTKNGWKIDISTKNELSMAANILQNIASGQNEYQRRLSTLALSKHLMELAQDGELVLEVLEWINKSSGRGEFKLIRVGADESVLNEKTIWGFGLKPYECVIQELFPWASVEVDYDFYDIYTDRDYVMSTRQGSTIYPYENRAGEVDAYRLTLGLNEVGRAFLTMDEFLVEGKMYNIKF